MGLLFLSGQSEDFVLVVEKIAQGVEHLGLGDAQRLGTIDNRFALPAQRNHVAHGHAQAVDDRLAAANSFQAHDVRVFGLDGNGHDRASAGTRWRW